MTDQKHRQATEFVANVGSHPTSGFSGSHRWHLALLGYRWYRSIAGRLVLLTIPSSKLLTLIVTLWLIAFFVFPLFLALRISFSNPVAASPPYSDLFVLIDGTLTIGLTLANYLALIIEPVYLAAMWQSLKVSFFTTILAILIGYPMALAVHRSSSNMRSFWLFLILIPFVASFLLRVYGLMIIMRRGGVISDFLLFLDVIDHPINLLNSSFAAQIGLLYVYLPFAVIPIFSALERQPRELLEAAADLGATPLRTFWSVTFPLSRQGVLAACVMVFVPCMGDFGTLYLLGDKSQMALGQVIWVDFFTNRDWPRASAVATVLTVLMLILVNLVSLIGFRMARQAISDR